MLKRTITLLLILLLIGLDASVSAQELNRAALVVMLENGETVTRCVEFAEDELTGLEVVNRSGLELVTATEAMGPAVCSLEGIGCPATDCFCQCKGGDCVYWSYWHLRDGEWSYSQAGASVFQVQDGMVEGWTFGPGTPQDALEPPLTTFDEVCTAQVVEPIAEPASTEVAGVAALEPTVAEQVIPATAVPTPDPEASGQPQWFGYALLGLIIVGLGGLMLVRGRKG